MVGSKRTLHSAAVATANGAVYTANAYTYVLFQVIGTFVGTITFEASLDGTNWHAVLCYHAGTGVSATTTTATGLYLLHTAGLGLVRARISAYTSGSITVEARGDEAA